MKLLLSESLDFDAQISRLSGGPTWLVPTEIEVHGLMVTKPKRFIQHHKDGTVWAKGQVVGDVPVGYWQWFRKSGTISRSGHFEDGIQVGEWTTYDKDGNVYKVTQIKGTKGKRATVDLERNDAASTGTGHN